MKPKYCIVNKRMECKKCKMCHNLDEVVDKIADIMSKHVAKSRQPWT